MAVTNFSPLLGLALPTTGDLNGTWGTTVNDSITQLLDSAVAGTTTLSADADVTLSTTNGASNQARNAVILWTASNGGTTRNITAPAQSKAYVVINAGTGPIVIRGAGPTTGVTVPSGTKALVAWNGSDFVKVASNPAVLTTDVSGILPIANGGTGTSSTTFTNLATNVTGTLPVANGGTGITSLGAGVATFLGTPSSANLAAAVTDETGSGSLVFATSPTLVTPALGTPSSGTLTNATGLPIDGGTTGTLPVARGGTGATDAPNARTGLGATTLGSNLFTVPNPSAVTFPQFNADNTVSSLDAASFRAAIGAGDGSGSVTSVSGTGTVNGITLTGTVTSAGNLTLGGTLSGVNLTTQVTGTLPVANGGTGVTTSTGTGAVVLSNSPTLVTPNLGTPSALVGTNITGTAAGLTAGNVTTNANLTGAVTSVGNATSLGSFTSAQLAAAVTDETGSGGLVFATSPTLVTPALGTPASGVLSNTTVDGTNKVGYLNIPYVADKTSSYVLALGDIGEVVGVGSGGSITIPDATFAAGDAVLIFNNTSGDITITCTITTAYIAGTDSDVASVTLATRGLANILFISGTVCVLTGNIS